MNPEEVLELLRSCRALLRGHFLLTSGRHGDGFVQCSQVMQYPKYAELLGRELARRIGLEADVVVGPAMGGVVLAHEVARAIGARSMFTEKTSEGMKFRRGFTIAPGSRVIVVEDVVTTGGSVRRTAEAVLSAGGQVIAMGAIVDRSGGEWARSEPHAVPKVALAAVQLQSFEPDECPMCRAGEPLIKPKD